MIGSFPTGSIVAATQGVAQPAPTGSTDYLGGISSIIGSLGGLATQVGSQYKSIDQAFDGRQAAVQQGSTQVITTGGSKPASGDNWIKYLIIGGGVSMVGLVALLAFKK